MPEYAVPYAFHLLTCRHETPSYKGSGKGNAGKGKYYVGNEIDESGQKVLKKRLKALYDPLVLQLGASADNISFLLRMAEMLAKSFQPIGVTSASGNNRREQEKLKNICVTSREVLLSYVKTDANLDTHPGAIRMPGNLFRKRVSRKMAAKSSSSTADTISNVNVMTEKKDDISEGENLSREETQKRPARSRNPDQNNRSKVDDREDPRKQREVKNKKRFTRSSIASPQNHRDSDIDSKTSADSDIKSRNEGATDEIMSEQSNSRRSLRRSRSTNDYPVRQREVKKKKRLSRISIATTQSHDDGDSKTTADTEIKSGNETITDEIIPAQNNARRSLRRSTRLSRSSNSDGSSLSIMSASVDSETERESTGNDSNNMQLNSSAEETACVVAPDLRSPEGKVNLSTARHINSSDKRRRFEESQSSRVHFSPEVDFGGLSPINRRSTLGVGKDETLLSSSETKTRGTTPPSTLLDAKFTATESVAINSVRTDYTHDSENPTTVSESTSSHSVGASPSQSHAKKKPLGDKKIKAVQSTPSRPTRKLAVDDKENPKVAKKKKQIPKKIKIVRSKLSPKLKVAKVVKKKARARSSKRNKSKPIDSFDFEG